MPKLTEYPQATGFDANDILIKDGTGGTKKITIEDFIAAIVDGTLTASDKVAPASAVGEIKETLDQMYSDVNSISLWEQGSISRLNGTNLADGDTNHLRRIRTIGVIPEAVTEIHIQSGYRCGLYIYKSNSEFNESTKVGWWTGSSIETASSAQFTWLGSENPIMVSDIITAAKQLSIDTIYLRLVLSSTDNGNIGTDASSAVEFISGPLNLNDFKALTTKKAMSGIPVLELTGDVSGMSKDAEKSLTYEFKKVASTSLTGTCEVKWQGSSSVRYGKKNYTVKITDDSGFDGWLEWIRSVNTYRRSLSTGYTTSLSENNDRYNGATKWWGTQKKFCLKANYIDSSHTRNVASARLWGQMVKARIDNGEIVDTGDMRAESPNYGAIDGFPIEVRINGESQGLYTFTIPKDGWMMSMGTEDEQKYTEFIVGGENNAASQTTWNAAFTSEVMTGLAKWAGTENGQRKAYSVGTYVLHDKSLYRCAKAVTGSEATIPEPGADGETYWVKLFDVEYEKHREGETSFDSSKRALTSLNDAIALITNANTGDGWDIDTNITDKLDINSVFDYFIFTMCIANEDAMAKNILYGTYDGNKWFFSAYDMDTTFGSNPYGTDLFSVSGSRCNWDTPSYRLVNLMKKYSPVKLKQRWDAWRKGVDQTTDIATGNWGESGKYINLTWSTGYFNSSTSPSTTADNPSCRYFMAECSPGDKFKITAAGGRSSRAYGFVAYDGEKYNYIGGSLAPADAVFIDAIITAPEGATHIVVNDTTGTGKVESVQLHLPAVLSEENVFETLSGFAKDIPTRDYDIDREIWPELPLTSADNVARYMEFYRMHVKLLDEQIEAMQPSGGNG